ncbi:hypothetical protein WR25_06433 [Diploscapter pachys]|uniref:CCDC66 domain-containing protein n=1 Tax=Diploscapter pachys TaxID=2018661 RepID=A0A2A2K8V7_9BILA|nr:hypothetical protein WR25_06433 [Diploscapter pachys]
MFLGILKMLKNQPSTSANHLTEARETTAQYPKISENTLSAAMSSGYPITIPVNYQSNSNSNGYPQAEQARALPNMPNHQVGPSGAPIPIAVPIAFPPGYGTQIQTGRDNGQQPYYAWPHPYAQYAYPVSFVPQTQPQQPPAGFTSMADCPLTQLEQAGYGWTCPSHCLKQQHSNESANRGVDFTDQRHYSELEHEHQETWRESETQREMGYCKSMEVNGAENGHLQSTSNSIPSDPSSRNHTGRASSTFSSVRDSEELRRDRASSINSQNTCERRQSVTIPQSVYDEQIAEKRRLERVQMERERLEEERVRRDEEELQRRRDDEERRLREKMREKEEHLHLMAEAEEKKRQLEQEAELFKKAKLFRHVLLDGERNPEMEMKLLGVTGEEAEKILDQPAPLSKSASLSVGSSSSGEERNEPAQRPIIIQNSQPQSQPTFQRRQPGRISVRETKKEKLEAEKENGITGFTRRSALPILKNSPSPAIGIINAYKQKPKLVDQLSEDLNRTLIIQTKDHNDNENDKEGVYPTASSPASTTTRSPTSPRDSAKSIASVSFIFLKNPKLIRIAL